MHSVAKGSGGGASRYGSTRQDDYSDSDGEYGLGESDLDQGEASRSRSAGRGGGGDRYGDDGPDSDGSEKSASAPRTRRKIRSAGAAHSGAGGDDGEPTITGSKKWWWIGGALAVLLVLLLLGGFYAWRDHTSSSDAAPTSDAVGTNATSALPSTNETSINAELPATVSAVPLAPADPATDPVGIPSAEPAAVAVPTNLPAIGTPTFQVGSTTQAQDPAPSATYAAQITWFEAPNAISECGSLASDNDYVVRISAELYGDACSTSPLCGKWITLYQLEKDATAHATIQGISSNMTGHNLDLSRNTFEHLTSNLNLGTTLAQWWLTDEAHQPNSGSLPVVATQGDTSPSDADGSQAGSGAEPGGGGSAAQAGSGGGADEGNADQRVTIATAPKPPMATAF
ncbi:hypothetical protein JCM8202v2_005036 [Rhodotorula sphaerocarpa]